MSSAFSTIHPTACSSSVAFLLHAKCLPDCFQKFPTYLVLSLQAFHSPSSKSYSNIVMDYRSSACRSGYRYPKEQHAEFLSILCRPRTASTITKASRAINTTYFLLHSQLFYRLHGKYLLKRSNLMKLSKKTCMSTNKAGRHANEKPWFVHKPIMINN